MEMIMFDTLSELGVKTSEKAPAPPPSRAKRPKTAKQRSIIFENGKVIQERAPLVVDFSAEPDMYIPDDKTSQISSLPSDGTLSSATSSSGSSESGGEGKKVESNASNSDASKTSSSESGSSSESESEGSNAEKPPPKTLQRRTSSLPSQSRREYLNPTNLAYRLSSSSEIEEHLRRREKIEKIYKFKHYGRETSLDRESSNNEEKHNKL
uniref:Uncharacterized protein n=1 Tax=Panagrolaimus superbus TaxID=310955 RepID=A0A914YIA1_9BILA